MNNLLFQFPPVLDYVARTNCPGCKYARMASGGADSAAKKRHISPAVSLVAGGVAGAVEATMTVNMLFWNSPSSCSSRRKNDEPNIAIPSIRSNTRKLEPSWNVEQPARRRIPSGFCHKP